MCNVLNFLIGYHIQTQDDNDGEPLFGGTDDEDITLLTGLNKVSDSVPMQVGDRNSNQANELVQSSSIEDVEESLKVALKQILKAQKESASVKQMIQNESQELKQAKRAASCWQRIAGNREKSLQSLRAEYEQYKTDTVNSITSLREQNEILKEQNEDLYGYKDESMTYRLERVHELNQDDLHQLKVDLNEGLDIIQKERDTRSKCVICYNNPKNIYFIDGCDHLVICARCESEMSSKVCPQCQTPYSLSKQLQL